MTDINESPDTTSGAGATGTDGSATPDTAVDLADRITYLTVLLRRADMLRSHDHRAGFGRSFGGEIRSGQGRVLGILALQSPLTQKNLAYMLDVRPQSLSELVSKLEAKGLVTRERDDSDRRSFLIELTAAGREAAEEIGSMAAEDPFDVLTDEERSTFAALTDKVISAVEETFPDDRGPGERGRRGGWGGPGGRRGYGRGHGPGHGPGHRPDCGDDDHRGPRTDRADWAADADRGEIFRDHADRVLASFHDLARRHAAQRAFLRRGVDPRFA